MSDGFPLLSRGLDDVIATVDGMPVSCRTFLGQVEQLAESLPTARFAINLCEHRYLFMLGFVAAIVRGQCNILLPSRQPGAIDEALQDDLESYLLHDGKVEANQAPQFNIQSIDHETATAASVPIIPDDHLCAIVYTSGSTGRSQRLQKFWRTLREGSQINRSYVLDGLDETYGVVATVPPWHMYGLEYTVLLPLVASIAIDGANSLFPAEICNTLKRMPKDRILVSTPVHLRAMVNSQLEFPSVSRVLSATAPLTQELARQVEEVFSAEVLELYGCSEAGCLAFRRPVTDPAWRFFDELQIDRTESRVIVSAEHLAERVSLSDDLEFDIDGSFTLRGRDDDLVKIGGKRGSLAELTNRLLSIEGVTDAVMFRRSIGDPNSEGRLSALVVSPERTVEEIRRELKKIIDPVFLPRPIRRVDSLPRNQTGKIRRMDLEALCR